MNKNQNEFTVIFDGRVELINAEVLISNLLNTTNILGEINKELKGPKINISIKPFELGSFDIIYAIAHVATISGLLDSIVKNYDAYLGLLISILSNIFKLKKFLGEENPKEVLQEGSKIKIIRSDNTSITVDARTFNFYKSNIFINDALNKSFRLIDKNEDIEAFLIKDKEKNELFRVSRKDFKRMYLPNPLIEEGIQYKVIEDAKLVIFKIVFGPGYKWAFIYEETKINAYISDKDFFHEMKQHAFQEGDYFIAKMKIKQKYDKRIRTFINEDYEIMEIKEHIKIGEQQAFDFPAGKDNNEK